MRFNSPLINRRIKIESLLFNKIEYIFKNIDEIKNNSDIFSNAKKILFYAGELYFDFFENPEFIKNIKESSKNGVVEAVFGPALYVESIDFIKMACKEPNIHLYKRKFRDPAHFKVITYNDNTSVAIVDKSHPINVNKNDRESVLLLKGYDKEIAFLEEKYKSLKKDSTEITVQNIMDEFSNVSKVDEEFYGFITRNADGDVTSASEEQINDFERSLRESCPARPTN